MTEETKQILDELAKINAKITDIKQRIEEIA